jgi:hypothetical protein
MRRATMLPALLLGALLLGALPPGGMAAPAAPDPFGAPVKDCHPCRFSPGPGQPELSLTFVFDGSGDQKSLTALQITPAAGGPAQRLETGDIAVSDFPDGFAIDDRDLNGDGFADLGIITLAAADNATEAYWLYEPKSRRFVALERDAALGDACPLTPAATPGELRCHVVSSLAEYSDIWYRIDGHRTVAVRQVDQRIDGPLLVHVTTDLSSRPGRVVKTDTVGFVGASPARAAFRKQLAAASRRAAARYRAGDKPGAVAALEPLLKDKNFLALTGTDPMSGKPEDPRLVGELNNYGFYLEEAGRPADATRVLMAVTDIDPDRTVAYLNLADAQFASGDRGAAKASYAAYRKRMIAAGKAARVPARVAERMR